VAPGHPFHGRRWDVVSGGEEIDKGALVVAGSQKGPLVPVPDVEVDQGAGRRGHSGRRQVGRQDAGPRAALGAPHSRESSRRARVGQAHLHRGAEVIPFLRPQEEPRSEPEAAPQDLRLLFGCDHDEPRADPVAGVELPGEPG
jgi:hypothetical protein